MAEHPDPTPVTSSASATDEILAMIAAEEPQGATADQVARALGLNSEMMQRDLEDLVAQGLLIRRGLRDSAIYTLGASAS